MKECKSCKQPRVTINLKEFDDSLVVKIAQFIELQYEFQLCDYLGHAVSMNSVYGRYSIYHDEKFSLWFLTSFLGVKRLVARFKLQNNKLLCYLNCRKHFHTIKEICEKVSMQFDIEVEITDGLSSRN